MTPMNQAGVRTPDGVLVLPGAVQPINLIA